MIVREVTCRSILTQSKLADYALNPYTGCANACRYCYASFMCRFTRHDEPWGSFVDVKVNAREVLARQLRRAAPGARVVMSSVCDPYQELEAGYGIARDCLRMLLDVGMRVSVLTKSVLVMRDFDLMAGRDTVRVEVSLATMDEALARELEPGASSPKERVDILAAARERGIRRCGFLGPLIPGIGDTPEALDALFEAVAASEPERIYVDRLNVYPGVWRSLSRHLSRTRPQLLAPVERIWRDPAARAEYEARLGELARATARRHGLEDVCTVLV